MQFPVSSGQHHRLNENEWVPVPTPKPDSVPKSMCTCYNHTNVHQEFD